MFGGGGGGEEMGGVNVIIHVHVRMSPYKQRVNRC